MFDERHLQLSAAYAKNSEYFIKTAVYPLVNFLYEKIAQRIREELENKLKLEIGEETYVMTPDEDGGCKWEKYDEETNKFVPTSDEVKEELNELVSETLSEQVSSNTESTSNKLDGLNKLILKAIYQALSESESTPTTTSESSVENSPETEAESTSTTTTETVTESVETPPETKTESTPTPHYDISETLLEPEHWREIVEGSAIAPEIAASNFRSLNGNAAWYYLFYSEKLERTNTGRLSTGTLNTYSHIETGGWWCDGGDDPRSFANLQPGEAPDKKDWGCFKPNTPRVKKDETGQVVEGKFIKYEHPPKVGTSIFLLDVPNNIAERIYDKAGVQPSESDRASGFWYCVWKHNVPVIITEGAKKTASLLSQGHAAIGVPGINNGYRARDKQGNPITPVLQDELAVFATPGREVQICFDYESKRKTKRNIDIATYRTGQLFEDAGSKVSVVQLPGPDKGVDDFIVAQGSQAFEELHQKAQPLQQWHENHQQPDLRLTVFLKNGKEIRLYEQKGDGTVNVNPQEEAEEQIFGTPRKKTVAQELESEQAFTPPTTNGLPTFSPLPQINTNFDKVVADYHQQNQQSQEPPAKVSSQNPPPQPQPAKSWARQQKVTLYQQTGPRKQLEERENGEVALAAFHLVKNYGVRQETKDGEKEVSIYHADAFAIKNNGDNYTIFRRSDKKVLMTFEAKQSATPNIRVTRKPQEMLPVERQEFLLVSHHIKSGKPLPSPDEDPRKIANTLGSLSQKGTHAILESFKQKEVFEVLAQTLYKFERDDLTLGNYRILYQKKQHDSSSRLQLLKTDNNGTTRVAASFDINKTQSGMTYQVKTLAVNELDLNKLKLLAQKLDIPQKATTANPYATRDTEVAIHPAIAKYIDRLIVLSPLNDTIKDLREESPLDNQTNHNQTRDTQLPLHPELAEHWQDLEINKKWTGVANQYPLRQKLKEAGKLTIGEQRELYQKLVFQREVELNRSQKSDISLPPFSQILDDLRCEREKAINNTYSPKVEVIKPQQHRNKPKSNELEL